MTNPSKLIIATNNPGKRRELIVLLGDLVEPGWEVFDCASWPEPLPEVVEDRDTFHGNAIKKALETAQRCGCAAIADDSGLEVDALDKRPGVYSARYAGPDCDDEANNALLLEELADVEDMDQRSARYVAVIAIALGDDPASQRLLQRAGLGDLETIAEGEPQREGVPGKLEDHVLIWFRDTVEGQIIEERKGTGGFGYDPYFWLPARKVTMAELTMDQKNAISHRAGAIGKLADFLRG